MSENIFTVANFRLQRGGTLPEAKLAYKTYGTLSRAKDNAVLFPTWFGTKHSSNEWLIGPGKALDTDKWFVIVPGILGNGASSSPSNTPAPFDRGRFPLATLLDNIRLQYALLKAVFLIERLHAVIGRSMGAQQAYQWASLYPDMVPRVLPFCGSARTSRFNYVFLAGLKAALTGDASWKNGEYETPPLGGLHAVGRLYASWALSYRFYDRQLDQTMLGFSSPEDFMTRYWEKTFEGRDANDLLAQIATWQQADISDNETFGGDLKRALGAIRARTIVMPCRTDQYFLVADSEREVQLIADAELRVIESDWGHRAGTGGTDPVDIAFIERAVTDVLEDRRPR
ncbi:alpha/beta fold hydrolase [Bradyrhizobium sp. CCGB12]|uniref:alpha/beta fold hydrolase n=1 Tax=Bradyrhizobium sp. CCGB12 TaxID=2949632 RepID=UPI0020B359C8|nr:alpha/beta fold hydrolase [Bradyrhizobium sp. CCGB12]MCP3387784.1 alpha/beta fold hydrolase [Bradyrhizobium sp. CCGB12]